MGFTAAVELMRTPAERRDQELSWRRSDRAFFASGACHILAFGFRDSHPDEGWVVVEIAPRDGRTGTHVYASDGVWAFDFNGWTEEDLLLSETTRRCQDRWPGWDFDRVVLAGSLDDYCADPRHRARHEFAHDPLPRADAFIASLSRQRPP